MTVLTELGKHTGGEPGIQWCSGNSSRNNTAEVTNGGRTAGRRAEREDQQEGGQGA